MTESHWREIESVFNRALDIPAAEREAWLIQTCGSDADLLSEVRSLLENDNPAAETLSASVKEAITALPAPSHAVKYAGPYELISELGRGGMGTVYKARRADETYEAIVAVKLVRPGMDTSLVLSRFLQERQTLARLNHPNIARLLDGGATADGAPYLVMEYVDGVRITEYCRREKLTLEQRLRLMLPVCLATDHAHRNFIVHRDIKPGNILVDNAGTPKLLDFGICKLLQSDGVDSELTVTRGMSMLTPDYASPEQVRGETISVRSDVYSLGAVLYELLTGTKPHRFDKVNLFGIEEAICNSPITVPSQAAAGETGRSLRGDLDNIAMRALEKDPQRRYESAAALAEDIRRHLEQEPVSARPAGGLYRAGKFVRRHRALTGAAVAVLAASGIGTFVSVRQARRAEARERQIRSMARVFIHDVHDSIRDLPGATAARQKIVHTAVDYLDALAGSHPTDPELVRELANGYQRIGDLQGSDARGANLGDSRAALSSYAKAVGFWGQLLTMQPNNREIALDRLETMRRATDLQSQVEGLRAALPGYDRVEAAARDLVARFPGDRRCEVLLADLLTVSARRSREAGDFAASRKKGEEAVALALRLVEAAPREQMRLSAAASAEAALGMTLARMGDLKAAAKLYESATRRGEAATDASPQNVSVKRNLMIGYSHLGDILGYPDLPNLGEPAKAEAVYAKIVAIGREIAASDPYDARAATDLAIALMRWAVLTPALPDRERKLNESLGIIQKRLAIAPTNLTALSYQAHVHHQLAVTSEAMGRRAQALDHWRRAFEVTIPHLDKGVDAIVRASVVAARELALYEPLGDLKQRGPARLARVLAVAEASAARAKGVDAVAVRAQLARVEATHSIFHARLGSSAEAAVWRKRALDRWRGISTSPAFLQNFRKDMEEFERWRP